MAKKGSKKGTTVTAPGTTVTASPLTTTKPVEVVLKPWLPDKWDYEADVVVVGYGGAGAAAALAAKDAGVDVLALEKAPEAGGTSRLGCSGFAYIETADISAAASYLYKACAGTTPMDVCQAWAEGASKITSWLDEQGIEFRVHRASPPVYPNIPGTDILHSASVVIANPFGVLKKGDMLLFGKLDSIARRKGVNILVDTPAKELIQDFTTKEILGVWAENKGQKVAVKAKRGVIISTGGYDFNKDMVNDFLRPFPIKFVGWPYNTGDGIKMGAKVGASLWHMNLISGCGWVTDSGLDSEISWAVMKGPSFNSAFNYIFVNSRGSRYFKENPTEGGFMEYMKTAGWDFSNSQKNAHYPDIPSYIIFDEAFRLIAPLSAFMAVGLTALPVELGGPGEFWSADNSNEIEKGWIKKGNTIRELAVAIGDEVEPDLLEAAVARYNGFCATGVDTDFGRNPASLVPIEKPPYYALKVFQGGFNTTGGLRKNGKAQILDFEHNVIPRLYGAGVVSHTCGNVYSVSGANVTEMFAFGPIAGRNAAAETPWE